MAINPIQALQEIGWSELEARVYVALVGTNEALTGYQIAKVARTARANVYPVLERLVRRGALMEEPNDQGLRYRPMPFAAVAHSQMTMMEQTLTAIEAALPTVRPIKTLVTSRGSQAVFTQGSALVSATRHHLDVGASQGTVQPFARALEEARERGVIERFLCFDHCPAPGCGVCQDPIGVSARAFHPTGWLVFMRDDEDTLITVGDGDEAELLLTNMAPIRETMKMLFRAGELGIQTHPSSS